MRLFHHAAGDAEDAVSYFDPEIQQWVFVLRMAREETWIIQPQKKMAAFTQNEHPI